MIMEAVKSQGLQGKLATKRLRRTNDVVSVERLAVLRSIKIHVVSVQVQRQKKPMPHFEGHQAGRILPYLGEGQPFHSMQAFN